MERCVLGCGFINTPFLTLVRHFHSKTHPNSPLSVSLCSSLLLIDSTSILEVRTLINLFFSSLCSWMMYLGFWLNLKLSLNLLLSIEMGDVCWLIMVVRSLKCKDLTSILVVFEFEWNRYVLELGFRVLMIYLLNLELFLLYLDILELGIHGFVLDVVIWWFVFMGSRNLNLKLENLDDFEFICWNAWWIHA